MKIQLPIYMDTPNSRYHISRPLHLPASGGARAALAGYLPQPLVAVFPNTREALDFVTDMRALHSHMPCYSLPEIPLVEDKSERDPMMVHRWRVTGDWIASGGVLVMAASGAVMPMSASDGQIEVSVGADNMRGTLLRWLSDNDFNRTDLVWLPGHYAVRGGIVDLFPAASSYGLRVVFDDERVESLRLFDTETQRSCSETDSRIISSFTASGEKYVRCEGASLVVFEPAECERAAENLSWLWAQLVRSGQEVAPLLDWASFVGSFEQRVLRVTEKLQMADRGLLISAMPSFKGRLSDVGAFVASKTKEGYSSRFYGSTPYFVQWARTQGADVSAPNLTGGFIDELNKVLYISELDLSGAKRRKGVFTPPKQMQDEMLPLGPVVHEDYGIGRLVGTELVTLSAASEQEYLVLEFANATRLLMPAYQEYKLRPWGGDDDVKLDSLRRGRWKKATDEARERAREAACELLKSAAMREISYGYAMGPLPDETRELTDSFPYRETPDQTRAWAAVRDDMERPVPMDRVLVGDVGFGKTEIALRAAFKAAMSGYQVAVVVPTTLLAQQHYETFSSRLSNFPLRVEVLSRLKTDSQQKALVDVINDGRVDIVVGTHRLFGADVKFKNLGLLVVDEEHRFGVMHKERWRSTFPSSDVLQLSATPIPRTLQMSLSGIRDLSVLNTPPHQRKSVITVVSPWSEGLVKGAVMRELSRGGQVFWVHNRIESIGRQAVRLAQLFPGVSVDVAHGRMGERELEHVMEDFAVRHTKILLCTTIIESGLDIPGANTLIVDDAQNMGLAQLYQLRGRVGRRDEQAYAFFLYPDGEGLSRSSFDRMEAIAELDTLGSGFSLAQRDLAIRGGGEVIGLMQHGHSAKVGNDGYFSMLEEEISKLKGDYVRVPQVEWKIPVSVPTAYLEDEQLRIRLYRAIYRLRTASQIDDLRAELVDRFGPIPREVNSLLLGAAVRVLGTDRIELVEVREDCVLVTPALSPAPRGWIKTQDGTAGPGGVRGIKELTDWLAKNHS